MGRGHLVGGLDFIEPNDCLAVSRDGKRGQGALRPVHQLTEIDFRRGQI